MNNLMFSPLRNRIYFCYLFSRYKHNTVAGEKGSRRTDDGDTARRRATLVAPKNTRQKRYNVIISVMYGPAHPFLNGRHLSSEKEDASSLLPFDPAAVSPSYLSKGEEIVAGKSPGLGKKFISRAEMTLISQAFRNLSHPNSTSLPILFFVPRKTCPAFERDSELSRDDDRSGDNFRLETTKRTSRKYTRMTLTEKRFGSFSLTEQIAQSVQTTTFFRVMASKLVGR